MIVFHVTPLDCLPSIRQSGLRPTNDRIWICDWTRLQWAIIHVADHHRYDIDQMIVLTIATHPDHLIRTGRPGIWFTRSPIPTGQIL